MYSNPRYTNPKNGIMVTRVSDGIDAYLTPGSPEHQDAVAGAWGDIAPYVAPPDPDPLEIERATMTPFIRAFRAAMKLVPAPVPGPLHLLSYVTALVDAARQADPFADMVIWSEDVTQIIRADPDMVAFRDAVYGDLTADPNGDLRVDALCRIAMAIENRNEANIPDLVAAYGAIS